MPEPGRTRIPIKRVTKSQQASLVALFTTNRHPTKEEKRKLSLSIDLDLRRVDSWFQNKRRKDGLRPKKPKRKDVEKEPSRPKAMRQEPTISLLDRIADRSDYFEEDDDHDLAYLVDPRPNSQSAADKARLELGLPPNSGVLRSLEWACANARVSAIHLLDLDDMRPKQDSDTEYEEHEAITPSPTIQCSPTIFLQQPVSDPWFQQNKNIPREESEMEAAWLLLGFTNKHMQ